MQIPSNPKSPAEGELSAIADLLGHRRLSAMVRRARHLLEIDALLDQALPVEFKGQVRVMNINHEQLMVAVASGTTSTALRFYRTNILESIRLQSRYYQLTNLIVKVRPRLFDLQGA